MRREQRAEGARRARGNDEERVQLAGRAEVALRDALHAVRELHERGGERARAPGDDGRAPVGDELAVAREREHEHERHRVDDGRDEQHDDERRPAVAVAPAAEEHAELENHRCDARKEARHGHDQHVAVADVRELVGHDGLELVRLEQVEEPGRRADDRAARGAAERERVRHRGRRDRDARLRQVRLDAQALDDRVQPGRVGGRDLARADRTERELVRQHELGEREAGDDEQHRRRPRAGGEQRRDEGDVEEAEQEHRQEHPHLQAEIAGHARHTSDPPRDGPPPPWGPGSIRRSGAAPARSDSAAVAARTPAMTASEIQTGGCQTSMSSILTPMKARMAARPLARWVNRSITPASRKYSARRPSIANAFAAKTTKGACVTAKIAGTESTANTTSVVATTTNTASSGVAIRPPPARTTSRSPW